MPAAQAVHTADVFAPATVAYAPVAQDVHAADVVAAASVLYFPAPQLVQAEGAKSELYVPATHAAYVPRAKVSTKTKTLSIFRSYGNLVPVGRVSEL